MFNIFKRKSTPAEKQGAIKHHDPCDLTKSEYSTHWEHDQYCKECKCSVTTSIKLGGVCPSCGNVAASTDFKSWGTRGSRSLWVNNKKMYQYQYNGESKGETIEAPYEAFE